MVDLINPIESFKDYLMEIDVQYVDFGNGLIIASPVGNKFNIRQYHEDGNCLSSWVDRDEFMDGLKDLIKERV